MVIDMTGRNSIRILVADDHTILREGLCSLLNSHDGYEVVGQAQNGRQAVRMGNELKPDGAVLDISMPELNGIEATRQLIKEIPNIRILMLSIHSDAQYVTAVLKAGAHGYLLKECRASARDGDPRCLRSGALRLHASRGPGARSSLARFR